MTYPKDLTFDSAMWIVERIINIELDIYELDVFSTQETLTNAQFENYLADVVNRVDGAITPFLRAAALRYLTEEEFNTWIIRLIRRYFVEKAEVPMYDYPEEDEETKK